MTHNERVLQLLSDGKPHSHHELYALHVIGHSRISDLRKRGHEITCWREGDLSFYQLLGPEQTGEAKGVEANEAADLTASPVASDPSPRTEAVSPEVVAPPAASGEVQGALFLGWKE